MTTIYHILGADIPHHNRTILDFFQNELLPQLSEQQHIFYVVSADNLVYPMLNLHCFSTKKSLAKATVWAAKKSSNAFFILHGQYNFWIWLAFFFGKLPVCHTAWHIWGADLYETSTHWKFKWFYPFRRKIQKKFDQVWGTQGDLDYFWKYIRKKKEKDKVMYFPTKMPNLCACFDPREEKKRGHHLMVLLGNSGDRTNHHIQALHHIHHQLGEKPHILLPMGYPDKNDRYIQQVEQCAKRLFPIENVQILREKYDFADYVKMLRACDLGYFNFERQQGIGTISLLIQLGIPFVLNEKNPFIRDLQENQIPFLRQTEINEKQISDIRAALKKIDTSQIHFFPKQYKKRWLSIFL